MNTIDTFTGDYGFLSNFYASPCTIDGKTYETVEHYFQACKATDLADHERVRQSPTPGIAKKRGRSVKFRQDWEQVKHGVMLKGLQAKFAPGTDLAAKLLATQDAHLIEGNTWYDREWGCVQVGGKWVGQNRLGKLLMRVRQELVLTS